MGTNEKTKTQSAHGKTTKIGQQNQKSVSCGGQPGLRSFTDDKTVIISMFSRNWFVINKKGLFEVHAQV